MIKIFTLVLSVSALGSFAQSTTQQVYNLFQTNCALACHNGTGPGASPVFDTGGDLTAFRNNLVDATPVNPAAVSKGYKLVDPGHPHSSFILQKLGHAGWDADYGLTGPEGNSMPDNQPAMAAEDIELVRQWIIYGAPASGQVVDPQTLYNYYHVNGMPRIAKPEPPAAGTGFQVHMGPFFLNPSQEIEFYLKHHLNNAEQQKITRMDVAINDESHHYLLFQFEPGAQTQMVDGLRAVDVSNVFPDQTKYLVGWVDSDSTKLPDGTAYVLPEQTYFDLNYHLLNYAFNGDSILPGEAYVNFITENDEPKVEMISELILYPPTSLFIFNNGQTQTFTNAYNEAGSQDSIWIWFLSSHTHKYGTDYDIFKRNPDGTKGEQLYEGFYNTTYQFNQGYYDWQHPANLYLDEAFGELVPVKLSDGIIQEAKFRIDNPNEGPLVTFGLTTNEEMMLAFIQYTAQDPKTFSTAVNEHRAFTPPALGVYPNPTEGIVNLLVTPGAATDARLEVFDPMGRSIGVVHQGALSGPRTFNLDYSALAAGLYTVLLQLDGTAHTARLMMY